MSTCANYFGELLPSRIIISFGHRIRTSLLKMFVWFGLVWKQFAIQIVMTTVFLGDMIKANKNTDHTNP